MPVLSLDESLRSGIRRDRKSPVGSLSFSGFKGLRPLEFGAKRQEIISQPGFTGYSGTVTHPFPQLFRGRGVTLLVDETDVYVITESGGSWAAQIQTLYDAAGFEGGHNRTTTAIQAGGPWHFVDMYDNWMLMNGVTTLFKTGNQRSEPFVCNDVTIRTGCDFRDSRVLLGGFDPADVYALADWNTYWATHYDNAPDTVKATMDALGTTGPGGNWVQYSSIGGGDLLWFVSIKLMEIGYLNKNRLSNGLLDSATDWTLTAGWNITANQLGHTLGTTEAQQLVADQAIDIVASKDYRVTFTMSNRTAGSVNVRIAGTTTTANYATNGVHTFIFTTPGSGTMDFAFVPSNDLSAKISNISVQLQPDEPFGDTDYIFDLMQRNEFGFQPMPYQGDVVCLKPIGNSVIAYGEENAANKQGGIIALDAHDKFFGQRMPANLGSGLGVMGRGAVGGNEEHHLFLDETGELWLMAANLECERLGYQEIFEGWIGSSPTIAYDPQYREFYLSDGVDTYLFNRHGLSKSGQIPTSVFMAQGGLVGMLDGATDATIEMVTQPFDALAAGGTRKDYIVIHGVMVATSDFQTIGWQVYVDYKMDMRGVWTRTDAVSLDERGVASFNVPAVEARIVLTHPNNLDTGGLDSLQIDVSVSGKPGSRHWHDAVAPTDLTQDQILTPPRGET